jgi:hypothetical protein
MQTAHTGAPPGSRSCQWTEDTHTHTYLAGWNNPGSHNTGAADASGQYAPGGHTPPTTPAALVRATGVALQLPWAQKWPGAQGPVTVPEEFTQKCLHRSNATHDTQCTPR